MEDKDPINFFISKDADNFMKKLSDLHTDFSDLQNSFSDIYSKYALHQNQETDSALHENADNAEWLDQLSDIWQHMSQYQNQFDTYQQLCDAGINKQSALRMAFSDADAANPAVNLKQTKSQPRKKFVSPDAYIGYDSENKTYLKALPDFVKLYKRINGEEDFEDDDPAPVHPSSARFLELQKQLLKSNSTINTDGSAADIAKAKEEAQKCAQEIADIFKELSSSVAEIIKKESDKIAKIGTDDKSGSGTTKPKENVAQILNKGLGHTFAYAKYPGVKDLTKNLERVQQEAGAAGKALSGVLNSGSHKEAAATVDLVTNITTSVMQMGQAMASGNPITMTFGAVQGISSIITAFNKYHDEKLDIKIKQDQLALSRLAHERSEIEDTIKDQMGFVTKEQFDTLNDNMDQQIQAKQDELNSLDAKKDKDPAKIQQTEEELEDLKKQKADILKEVASGYGFDINDLAKNLTDAITDAFAKGKDAGKAFQDAVNSYFRNIVKNWIMQQTVMKSMKTLQDYLFGDNGALKDGKLTPEEVAHTGELVESMKDDMKAGADQWKQLSDLLKQYGIDINEPADDQSKPDNGITGEVKNITEDTADLLASYINSIRADVAGQLLTSQQLLDLTRENTDTFANQLAELNKIDANTLRSANNSDAIKTSLINVESTLRALTLPGGNTKLNIN